jgi:predicted transcriptional regulator
VNLTEVEAVGPNAAFSEFHFFCALEMMSERTIGRNRLSKELNVGVGSIRNMVNRLVKAGLVTTSGAGCSLTQRGLSAWKEFEEIFPVRVEMGRSELADSDCNFAFLTKNVGHKDTSWISLRNAAIRAGAENATIIVSQKGCLSIELVSEDIEAHFPNAAIQILHMKPEDNDVIVIASAKTLFNAKQGAFAASWSLIDYTWTRKTQGLRA